MQVRVVSEGGIMGLASRWHDALRVAPYWAHMKRPAGSGRFGVLYYTNFNLSTVSRVPSSQQYAPKLKHHSLLSNDDSLSQYVLPPPPTVMPSTAKVLVTDFAHTTPFGLLSAVLDTLCVQSIDGGTVEHFDDPNNRKALFQWLGMLSLYVSQYGPVGRFVSQTFLSLAPKWQGGVQSEAYTLPTDRLSDRFLRAADAAGARAGGRDWKESKLLLARMLYPVQVDRLMDTDVEDISLRELFDVTPLEASELPDSITQLFRVISARPTVGGGNIDPVEPYKSMFFHLRHLADQFFQEHGTQLLLEEGNAPLDILSERLREREQCRQLQVVFRHLESPTPESRRNVKRTSRRLMPGLPQLKTLREKKMSSKLENMLASESRVYYEVIGQKLLSLVLFHELPVLRARQLRYDDAGNQRLQEALIRTAHLPPRAGAIAEAFGIDVRRRRDDLCSWSADATWRLRYLRRHYADDCSLTAKRLPTFRDFQRVLHTQVVCPPRAYTAYLAFCDSPEAHSIQHWWNGEHLRDDADVRWRLGDTFTPETFVSEFEYGISPYRMPHTICITREFLESLLCYLRETSSAGHPSVTVMVVGTSAGRLAWYLNVLQHHNRPNVTNTLNIIAASVMLDSYIPPQAPECEVPSSRKAFPYPFELTGALGFPIMEANSLENLVKTIRPSIVICSCMPTGIDWSEVFRQHPHVQEYILLGPRDSDASGHPFKTWGCPTFFHKPRLIQTSCLYVDFDQVPPFIRDGFSRRDIPAVSSTLLGSLDTPG